MTNLQDASPMVEAARERWIHRLIDTSRNNNLLYYRASKTRSLDLSATPPPLLLELLRGEAVAVARLVPQGTGRRASVEGAQQGDLLNESLATNQTPTTATDKQELMAAAPPSADAVPPANAPDHPAAPAPASPAATTAAITLNIFRKAQENLEEKGISTLYVAMGSASWPATDGGRSTDAAVLMYPASIELHGRDGRNALLRLTGSPQFNLALSHVLRAEFGVVLAEDALLADDDDDASTPLATKIILERVRAACAAVPAFTLAACARLGNFSFAKIAMVRDLQELGEQLQTHPIIAAIAGDKSAQVQLIKERSQANLPWPDAVPPEADFTVLGADASQHRVILGVVGGQSGVIQGPPGTGKSQTIVNMIASLAAQGKRVLFVAEKRAALDVVKDRLARCGLDRLALDLHGADVKQRALMRHVAECLNQIRDGSPAVDVSAQHRDFGVMRQRVNEHDARMHTQRPISGATPFSLQGRLLRTDPAARSTTRWRGQELDALNEQQAHRVADKLGEAVQVADLISGRSQSPWARAQLDDGRAAQAALDAAHELNTEALPALRATVGQLAQAAQLRVPKTVRDIENLITLLRETEAVLERYSPELWQHDPVALAAALEPAAQPLKALWAQITSATYRAARKQVLSLRKNNDIKADALLAEVQRSARLLARWRNLSLPDAATLPQTQPGLSSAFGELDAVKDGLRALGVAFPGDDALNQDLDALTERTSALAQGGNAAMQVPHARELTRAITALGAGKLLAEIKASPTDPEHWQDRFQHAWLQSHWERARADDPKLAAFNGRVHDKTVAEFVRLDEARTLSNASRVRRAHAERTVAIMNEKPAQTALVRREAEKKSRHLPLRALIAQAPDVMTALFPCWMASPLSVSQLLDGTKRYFDVVLFDEASQILPEDAVCALLRGERAVVAGDKQQLPPSIFFAAGNDDVVDEADEPDETAGFESLLDTVQGFLEPWMLEWHYRSKDESLIAFSNRHMYQNRMVTFPAANGAGAVTHVLVGAPESDDPSTMLARAPDASKVAPNSRFKVNGSDVGTNSPAAEVQRVVQLILEHARTRPGESLGVITMGIRHAYRIQAALDAALADAITTDPELESFFGEGRAEPCFIKNLERVQGDERDAIILSIGYGKDASGKLPYRFGPLLSEGGERRLNVAITRARNRLTLVSSFSDLDMDPARNTQRGVELLRQYIAFARSNGTRLDAGTLTGHDVASPFEADVYEALASKGLHLIPQWGSSRFRIDFAVRHPRQAGRFVLAIECDGASYHSSASARDRDRLRQQQLEALGWRFHRIWSTDWFMRRDEEIARAMAAYEEAVRDIPDTERQPAHPTQPVVTEASHADSPLTMNAQAPSPPSGMVAAVVNRPGRPVVAPGLKIDEYEMRDLVALVRWIRSDGALRTHDELFEALFDALGLKRHGARIDEVLRQAARAGVQ